MSVPPLVLIRRMFFNPNGGEIKKGIIEEIEAKAHQIYDPENRMFTTERRELQICQNIQE